MHILLFSKHFIFVETKKSNDENTTRHLIPLSFYVEGEDVKVWMLQNLKNSPFPLQIQYAQLLSCCN